MDRPHFENEIERIRPGLLQLDRLKTLQVNLGNVCNQRCRHCHVQAGPDGRRIMTRPVMRKIVDFLQNHPGLCLDMTGGCPELNPDFRFLLEKTCGLVDRMMVRTNLTVFFEPGIDWVCRWYRDHGVVVVGSLPCYTQQNVDAQRGRGVFDRSIEAMRLLNGLGYGKDDRLELDLVYNPAGEFLPGSQATLEADYKKRLHDDYGVVFTRLFTITNAPIGRFRQHLQANGGLEKYLKLLVDNFNPDAIENIMCRSLVSIDYRGIAYNCDFNQALNLPIVDGHGNVVTIDTLSRALGGTIKIIADSHCYCCTAGVGSSCTGALVEDRWQ